VSEWTADTAEALVSEYFDSYCARGERRFLRMVSHPAQLIRAWRAISHLPTLEATLGSSAESEIVRQGLMRKNTIARASVRGTTAVLEIPSDGAAYLAGSGESKRSLRTKVRRAERKGFTVSTPVSRSERIALLSLNAAYERAHPDPTYRSGSPKLDHLLDIDTWLVAHDGTGRPLLIAVIPIDGDWAVLEHFRTLDYSDEAKLARPWLSALLVEHLAGMGVRHLADVSSPIGLPRGLRSFQRQLGYRLRRVRIESTAARPRIAPQDLVDLSPMTRPELQWAVRPEDRTHTTEVSHPRPSFAEGS
jgi:hypothetical protein